MPETRIQKTVREIGKLYFFGILIFVCIMGFITLFASFLAHLSLT